MPGGLSRFFKGSKSGAPPPAGAAASLRLLEALLREPDVRRRHRLLARSLRLAGFPVALVLGYAPDGQGGLRVRLLAGGCAPLDASLILEALSARLSPLLGLESNAPRWIALHDDPFRPGAAFLRKFELASALALPLAGEGAGPREQTACLAAAREPLAAGSPQVRSLLAGWSLYRTVTAPGWGAQGGDLPAGEVEGWPAARLWEAAPLPLAIVARDEVAAVNAAAERLLRASVGAEGQAWRTWLVAAVRRLEEGDREQEKLVASRQRELTLEVSLGPRLGGRGGRSGRLVAIRDATVEVQADSRSAEAISTISHELRTPLTSMKNSVGLLLRGEAGTLPEPAQHFLGMTMRNIDRLNRLISDLLDVSRATAGRLDLHRATVDLVPLLREALELFAVTARQRRLQLQLDCGPESFPAHVDADKVVQMLHNTVGNALKYTPEGGLVRVWLDPRAAGLVPAEARLVAERFFLPLRAFALIVEDNGEGISEEAQRRLFQPFARGREPENPALPSSGLGLHITRALVEAHGGSIRVDSTPGAGTAVGIVLPRDPASERVLAAARRLRQQLAAQPRARVYALDARQPGQEPAAAELRRAGRAVRDFVARLASGEPRRGGADDEAAIGSAEADAVEEAAPGLWLAVLAEGARLGTAWEVEKARPGTPSLLEATRWEGLAVAEAGEDAAAEQVAQREPVLPSNWREIDG